MDEGAVNGGGGVLPKSRARGAGEGDGAPPPAFPNPGREQRLILQFTMPPPLRLVNDTPRFVETLDNRIRCAAFQQNLLIARNFSPTVVSCPPVCSRSGGTQGGSRKTLVDANSQH